METQIAVDRLPAKRPAWLLGAVILYLTGQLVALPARAQPPGPKLPEHAVARLAPAALTPPYAASGFEVAFLPDGKHLVTGGNGRPVQFWETASGKECLLVPGLPEPVTALALSPDGAVLALGVRIQEKPHRSQVQLFSTKTAKMLKRFDEEPAPYTALTFSGDGLRLAGRNLDMLARVWDIETGKLQRRLLADLYSQRHFGQPQLALAPDGSLLATLGKDYAMRVYRLSTGQELPHFGDRQGHVMAIGFTPDGKHLVTGQGDNSIRLWELASGKQVRRLEGHEHWPVRVAVSADGKQLVSADADYQKPTMRLWDLETGKEVHRWAGPRHGAYCLALSGDGKRLAASGNFRGRDAEARARLWDTTNGQELFPDDPGETRALVFSPDGRTLITGATTGLVRAWDVASFKEQNRLADQGTGDWGAAAFAPGGEVAIAVAAKELRLWETATGKLRRNHPVVGSPRTLAFNGSRVAFVSDDHTVRVIEVDTGQLLYSWQVDYRINGTAISPDLRFVALVNADTLGELDQASIYLYRLEDGKKVLDFPQDESSATGLAFSPDGRMLAASCPGYPIRLFETVTGKERPPLNREPLPGYGQFWPTWSPDGKLLALVSRYYEIAVLEVASGQRLGSLTGHRHLIRGLAFSPDGKLLASAARDVVLWKVTAPKPLAAKPLTDQELADCWPRLGKADAKDSYAAMQELALRPAQAVPLLRAKLLAAVKNTKAVRAPKPPLPPLTSPDLLQILRGVEVLERIGTRDAGAALEALSQAASSDGWLAKDIRWTLQRVQKP